MSQSPSAQSNLRQYMLVTANYWGFTLTDGALRMLVLLYFYQLGYSPLELALLFVFYEFFGVVTNLVGGWLGARIGLNRTMHLGLFLQLIALGMLAIDSSYLSTLWVMSAQALSGIAKDLNKMSAKSAVKFITNQQGLYTWVAVLTGSKNTLKGVGFFLGGLLLSLFSFQGAMLAMLAGLTLMFIASLVLIRNDLGKAKSKPKFSQVFSTSRNVNALSAARFFLFGSRDVWFVVALPVFLAQQLGWAHWAVGSFLASWIIGYGMIQASAPALTRRLGQFPPTGQDAKHWALALATLPLALGMALYFWPEQAWVLLSGLAVFALLFAINSSVHSYLIVHYAKADGASMDVGFYYMANAAGRLVGTVISGAAFQAWGIVACLMISATFVLAAWLLSAYLESPEQPEMS